MTVDELKDSDCHRMSLSCLIVVGSVLTMYVIQGCCNFVPIPEPNAESCFFFPLMSIDSRIYEERVV